MGFEMMENLTFVLSHLLTGSGSFWAYFRSDFETLDADYLR